MRKKLLYIYLALLGLIIIIFHKPIFSVTTESILLGKNTIQKQWDPFSWSGESPLPVTKQDFLKDSEHLIGKALLNWWFDEKPAVDALYHAIEKDPTNPLPHLVMAQILLEPKLSRSKESVIPYKYYDSTPAILHLKKAVQLDPDNGYLHHTLAEAYFARFGRNKIKALYAEIKKGNQAKNYHMYEAEMVKAAYNCQRDEWLTEFSKRMNAVGFGACVHSLFSKQLLANTLVAEGERLRLTGDNQQAIGYFSETLQYGDLMVNNSRSLISQMIAVAIKSIARQPLTKVYHIEKNQQQVRRLGLDFMRDELRCLRCAKRSEVFGAYLMWTIGHGINALILGLILIGSTVLLFLRLGFSGRKKIRIEVISVFTYVCFYFTLCSVIVYVITSSSKITWQTYNRTIDYSLAFLLPLVIIAAIYVTYKIIRTKKAKALKEKGLVTDKQKSVRFSPVVIGLLICVLPFYLTTIFLNYQTKQKVEGVLNVNDFDEIPEYLQVTDKEAKETLDDYLDQAASILAKMERNEELSTGEIDNEDLILRGLFYSQDERFIEILLPKLEMIADRWPIRGNLAENPNPAFLPVATKLLNTKAIEDCYDWRLPIIREHGDSGCVEPLRKVYSDRAKKEDEDGYERNGKIGALTAIAATLFRLGEKKPLYDLIEACPESLGQLTGDTLPSITYDERIRGEVIKQLGKGELWDRLSYNVEYNGWKVPFQNKAEIKGIIHAGAEREELFGVLRAVANEHAIDPLMEMLDKENSLGVGRITFALGELGAKKAVGIIENNLTSSESHIRCSCIYALSKLISQEELKPILDQYEHDPDFYVRQAVWQLKNLD